jgi:NAD(P)-dependent dehydrogenase (short-subunit alcohol dehydrogenase family)
VRDYEQIVSAVERLTVQFGGVHVLICAHASLGAIGPLASADPIRWEEAAATNLVGTMKVCRAVLPGMVQLHAGSAGPLRGDPGRGSSRGQCAGELHEPRRHLYQSDG